MNTGVVFYTLGSILILNTLSLVVPLVMGLVYPDYHNPYYTHQTNAFLITIVVSLSSGFLFRKIFASARTLTLGVREGFGIVALAWFVIALIGALPFYLSGIFTSFTDAFFESMSGFTTTGASVLKDVESLPHGLIFWRSFTHFIGGMGIVVMALSIFPALGIGGYQLFKLEAPGGSISGKLKPRVIETAYALWQVYLLLNLLEIVLLLLGGMPLFDAVCHSFATIATGGFSTKNTSIAYFNSAYISYVIIIFMFLSACSFRIHYSLLHGRLEEFRKDPQWKTYLIILLSSIFLMTITLYFHNHPQLPVENVFRTACFQVVSIGTCTGFTTTDFNQWPDFCRFLLLLLMLIGGCAGSTTGAIKQIRFIVLVRLSIRLFTQLIRPNQVIPIKIGDIVLEREVVANIVGFFILYVATFLVGSLLLTAMGVDIISALASVASTLGGVGPGLGLTALDYTALPVLGKWLLILCMLMGRLEIFGIIILMLPLTWKK